MSFNTVTSQTVAPFAGKWVAFRTTPERSYFSRNCHKINNICFGCISGATSSWDVPVYGEEDGPGENGYNIHRLIKSNAITGNVALIDSKMKGIHFEMRECTSGELQRIKNAISNGNAKYDSAIAKKADILNRVEKQFLALKA